MSPGPGSGGVSGEAWAAGSGLIRLVRRDPSWATRFTLTTGGFVRSFAGPLLALPLAMLDTALYLRADAAGPALGRAVASEGVGLLVDALGFPVLLAMVAGLLRFKPGYAAFVTVNNWATLYLNLLLTAAAPLALLGPDGVATFGLVALILLCVSVALVWRIARETLTHELAPLVLVVVLSVAWSTAADEVSRRIFGV